MKQLLMVLALSFICALAEAKPIIIGTLSQNPPFESLSGGKDQFYGFEIDIVGAICQRAKLDCQFKAIPLYDLFPQLLAKKIDLTIASIAVTQEREKIYLFSHTYLKSTAQFITKKTSTINTIQDISNKVVGTRYGRLMPIEIENILNNKVILKQLPDLSSLFMGLDDSSIDAVFLDSLIVQYWAANNDNTYKIIGPELPTGSGYAIMGTKDEQDLMQQINTALDSIMGDGTYEQIYGRYFFIENPKLKNPL